MTKKNTVFDAPQLQRRVESYVARFLVSQARLRGFIDRSLRRAANRGEVRVSPSEIEHIVQKAKQKGFIDDRQFALSRCQRWHQSGLSIAAIRQRLQAEQIAPEDINKVLAEFDSTVDDGQSLDKMAAMHFARKRSIGPFRQHNRDACYQRDLAKLARRGFSRDTAVWLLAQPAQSLRSH